MRTTEFTSLLVILSMAWLSGCSTRSTDSGQLRRDFKDPPREFCTAPLWVWSEHVTEQQVREALHDLASQNVRQAFVHPRPGLMTPYLSDEWFRLWKVALDEAERLDMNLWIYDEDSYPSGFGGGLVPDAMPESRGRGLAVREFDGVPQVSPDLVAVYAPQGDGYVNVTADATAGTLAKGKYLTATVVYAEPRAWHGGKTYVDLLYPGVTEKFLEITHEAYRKHFGNQFGKRIPGSFTDEPEIRPAGGLPWTPDLPEVFEQRWGYSLLDHLPCLVRDVGDFKRVRHNYLQVLNDLFIERWSKPYHDYCAKYDLEFTGHYWEHEWPSCLNVPDNMAMYAWHQRPAIDNLFNMYSENLHAQFGNTRTVRELASVARQLNRPRTLCEAYGAGGWDLRFEDMKRIGDWLYVLGVNTLDEHLSDITLRGARKRDHPQSFSYHEPWWEGYHVLATYRARLSAALSAGKQNHDVLLIEPTTTAWLYNSEAQNDPRLLDLGRSFEAMIRAWEQAQLEYDLGSEDILARHGSVKGNVLAVGAASYCAVVIPAGTENLNATTVKLLRDFLAGGGQVWCCSKPPVLVDGAASEQITELASDKNWRELSPEETLTTLLARQAILQVVLGGPIVATGDQPGQVYHQRRILDDGQLLFLVNTKIDQPASGTISARAAGIEEWDAFTGEVKPYAFQAAGENVEATYQLPPCGSLLLFISPDRRDPAPAPAEVVGTIAPRSDMAVEPLDPNVLTLDYVDVACQGETRQNWNVIRAGHWLFAKHGLDRNPWDRAVQFKDELIRRTFPADSGFEATYRFTIRDSVPAVLSAVIERADLYTITCNGRPIAQQPGAWWLDKLFGKVDIAQAAKVGDNTLTIKATPFTMYHELEAVYLLGSFAVKPADKGFVIAPPAPLKLGPWNEQGMRMFGHRVAYTQKFELVSNAGRFVVRVPKWYGSVAKVVVNGNDAGYLACAPWQCDATPYVRTGENTVQVIVFGTLRNTLGPHFKTPPGITGPGHFDQAPEFGPPAGSEYMSIGYGLFEPFVLEQSLAK